MATVNIIIDVTGEPPGTPGESRTFTYAKIAAVPPLVTLSIEDPTGVFSYLWEILAQPAGASAVLDDPTSATPTFTPTAGIDGTYIIRCRVNGGEAYQQRGIAFTTKYSALRKMAPGETIEFNADRGYAVAYDSFVDKMDGGGGGGGARLRAVIDIVDCTAAPPSSDLGDRYILDDTAGAIDPAWGAANKLDVVENVGGAWAALTPEEGNECYVDARDRDYRFIDDGVPTWEPVVGGIFEVGGGILSSQRRDAGMTTLGDYAFNTGYGNSLDALSAYASVFGSGNTLIENPRTQIFGHDCVVFDTTSYFAKPGPGGNHIVSPYPNGQFDFDGAMGNVAPSPLLLVGNPIPDGLPQMGKAVIDGDTYWYSAWTNEGVNTPNGEFTLSVPPALTRTYLVGDRVLAGSMNMSNSYVHGAYNLLNNVGGGIVFGAYNTLARAGGTETLIGAAVFGGLCTVSGHINFVGGMFATVSGYGNFSYGQSNTIYGDYNGVLGINNMIPGNWQFVFGEDNTASGTMGVVVGNNNQNAASYSLIFGQNNVVGFAWSGTGLAKTTTYARGGSNITAAGNDLGNDHLKVQNTVLAGFESAGPAPVRIVDINEYFFTSVTDTPTPRFVLDSTLAETSAADQEVVWGNIAGIPSILPLAFAPLGSMPPIGVVRLRGTDSYLAANAVELAPGYWAYTDLDRPLDDNYVDADTLEVGNLAGSPIFWCNEDTTVMPSSGTVIIDGDTYTYSGVGMAWPGLWGIGLDTPLTRDYPDGCTVIYSGASDENNVLIGSSHVVQGSGNVAFQEGNEISGNKNFVGGQYCNAGGNDNALFGYTQTITGSYSLVSGLNNWSTNAYSCAVFGSHNEFRINNSLLSGIMNDVYDTYNSIIGGYSNAVDNIQHSLIVGYYHSCHFITSSLVAGASHVFYGNCECSIISGYGNTSNSTVRFSAIFGYNNYIYDSGCHYSIIVGELNTVRGGNYNAIFGSYNQLGNNSTPANNIIAGVNISLGTSDYNAERNACFGGSYTLARGAGNIVAGTGHWLASYKTFMENAIFGYSQYFTNDMTGCLISGNGHTNSVPSDYAAVFGMLNDIRGLCCVIGGRSNESSEYGAAFGRDTNAAAYSLVAGYTNLSGQYSLTVGRSNAGLGDYTITGGYSNSGSGNHYSLIVGQSHSCTDALNIVVGGYNNTIASTASFSAMFGFQNLIYANSQFSLIAGRGNTINASSLYSIVAGFSNVLGGGANGNALFGMINQINVDSHASLVAGSQNVSDAYCIVGGLNNVAQKGSLVCGKKAYNRWPYAIAHSSGETYGQKLNTVDVPMEMVTSDGLSYYNFKIATGWDNWSLVIPSNAVILFDIDILAVRQDTLGEVKAWKFQFVANCFGGTASIEGTPLKSIISNASSVPWEVRTVSYGPAGGLYGVRIQGLGEAGKTILWQAAVRATEIKTDA